DAMLLGGNLSSGSELSLTTTIAGRMDGAPLTRSGAMAGDQLYVTGPIGVSALGLALLQRNHEEAPATRRFIDSWRRPYPPFASPPHIAAFASAAIDVSDGLLQDLTHLCEASGVGAEIDLNELPLDPDLAALANQIGLDPVELTLTGGEDYELLF